MKKLFNVVLCLISIGLLGACNNNLSELDAERGTISGTVTYSNATDASNIYLTVEKQESIASKVRSIHRAAGDSNQEISISYIQPDSDGKYTFKDIEVGTYRVYATSNSCVEQAVYTTVTVQANTIVVPDDLTLTATGSVKGVVTIDGNEEKNNGILVFISGTSYLSITDSKGNFTLSDVPAGSDYEVSLMKGTDSFEWTTTDVTPFETTDIGTFDLDSSKLTVATTGSDGKDGISLKWLGSFAKSSEIENAEYLNVYYNTTDGCSYIYDGEKWNLLSKAGAKGEDGVTPNFTINWLGEFYFPDCQFSYPFQDLDAFYNAWDGCSYIYYNGDFSLLAAKGEKGDQGGIGPKGEKGDKGDTGDSEQRFTYSSLHYTLQLVSMVGTFPQLIIPEEYVPGASLVLPTPTCEGKDFAGWFLDSEFMKECEYVSYDSSRGKYILTVPASYTGTLTLYAGFGKVCYSWEDFTEYLAFYTRYALYDVVFFSGDINVTSKPNMYSAPTAVIKLRGINNARWIINQDIGYLTDVALNFSIANITFDGGSNKRDFSVKTSSSYFANFVLYNCTFKNLGTSSVVSLNAASPNSSYLIEKCNFINNKVTGAIIGLFGVSHQYIQVKDCNFIDNIGGDYSLIFNPQGFLSLDNCSFSGNTGLSNFKVPGTEIYCNYFCQGGATKLNGKIDGLVVDLPVGGNSVTVDFDGNEVSPFMFYDVDTELITFYVNGAPSLSGNPEFVNGDGTLLTQEQLSKLKLVAVDGTPVPYNPSIGKFEYCYVQVSYPYCDKKSLGYEDSTPTIRSSGNEKKIIIYAPTGYEGVGIYLNGKPWEDAFYDTVDNYWEIQNDASTYNDRVSMIMTDENNKKHYVEYSLKAGMSYGYYEYKWSILGIDNYFQQLCNDYKYTITTGDKVIECMANSPLKGFIIEPGNYTFTLTAESATMGNYTLTEDLEVTTGNNSLIFQQGY